MKRVFIVLVLFIGSNAHSQLPCDFVGVNGSTDIMYAEDYITHYKEKTSSPLPSVMSTFQVADICEKDGIVMVELTDIHNALRQDTVRIMDVVEIIFPVKIILLSKLVSTPEKGEKMEIGKQYYMTIEPYFPKYLLYSDIGIPVILDGTAFSLTFFIGNVYTSPAVKGGYFIGNPNN